MTIRILAVDMDGTVLGDDRKPVAKSAEALRRAELTGIHIVLASGRTVASLIPFAEQMGIRPSYVACNGAYVVDNLGAEVFHKAVPTPFQSHLINYASETGTHLNVYSRNRVFDAADGPYRELYVSRVTNVIPERVTVNELFQVSATKLLLVDHPEKIAAHSDRLRASSADFEVTQTLSEPEYLEFLKANVHKALGLAAIAERLKVDQHQVAAIGDYYNDLEMIEWAGYSGAVANAAPEVKNAANLIVSSNSDGGVAEFIASFVHNL